MHCLDSFSFAQFGRRILSLLQVLTACILNGYYLMCFISVRHWIYTCRMSYDVFMIIDGHFRPRVKPKNKKKNCFIYTWLLPPTCVKTYNFCFQLEPCAECCSRSLRPLGRHVTFFTSNYNLEARGSTIITIQDSQDEIPGLTSKFWNFPLDTLNCNNKFCTFSSCYTG